MSEIPKSHSDRLCELRNVLNKAIHAYYTLDAPLIEDAVFDNLYRELLELEKQYPALIAVDSPSQRIGNKPSTGFITVPHKVPLQSLENAFNVDELHNWYTKIQKSLNAKTQMVCEMKIDGNALALSYKNGFLKTGATRGDGTQGEEITANIKTISSIPLSIHLKNPPPWMEVRGEAFISNESFEEINIKRRKEEKQVFANPRNACSGTLRQLDPRIVASRKLDFYAYTVHLPKNWSPNSDDPLKPNGQWEALRWLKNAGFKVNPNTELTSDIEKVKDFYRYWQKARTELPYATDGVVVKIEKYEQQSILGVTQKAPRWAIALKYPAEEAPTELNKITVQIGRTGTATPVAEFKEIALAGTLVSRATLHNANRLMELDLHKGDTIVVRKAGEIIPEVVKVITDLRLPNAERICLPKECPECGSTLIKEEREAATKCINDSCSAILRGVLRHWVSKGAMDIEGFGSKLIDQLVEKKLVLSISELYELRKEEIETLDRMGAKSAEKLLIAIDKSKEKPWSKQLYGLGILHIGEANAIALTKTFPNIEDLEKCLKTNPSSISEIYGIGNEILTSLQKWFESRSNRELVKHLRRLGISFASSNTETSDIHPKNNKINNKTVVITGTMPTLSRSQAKAMIEKAGGKLSSSISSKTSYLVAGEKAGSKLKKAEELGINIIKEKDLINLLTKEGTK